MEGTLDPRPATGGGGCEGGAGAAPGGGRGAPASPAATASLEPRRARLQGRSPCSLLQLRRSEFPWTLNCQASRSQEAREPGPQETPDPAPPFPGPAPTERTPVLRTHRELRKLRSTGDSPGALLSARGSLTRPPKSWGWRKGSQAHFVDEKTEEGTRGSSLPKVRRAVARPGWTTPACLTSRSLLSPGQASSQGCSRKEPRRFVGARVSCARCHSVRLVYRGGNHFCLRKGLRPTSVLSAFKGRVGMQL